MFDRDVNCLRLFFKKRFGFESETYPKFSQIKRCDNLDAEIYCSGYTKEMEDALNEEIQIDNEFREGNVKSDEEEIVRKEEDKSDSENLSDGEKESEIENCGKDKSEYENFKGELTITETDICEGESSIEKISKDFTEYKDMLQNDNFIDQIKNEYAAYKNKDDSINTYKEKEKNINVNETEIKPRKISENSNCSSDCNKKFESRSIRSTSTSIPLEEIKRRVKNEFRKKERNAIRKRAVAKGEASATTRNRRENRETIKFSHGIWE